MTGRQGGSTLKPPLKQRASKLLIRKNQKALNSVKRHKDIQTQTRTHIYIRRRQIAEKQNKFEQETRLSEDKQRTATVNPKDEGIYTWEEMNQTNLMQGYKNERCAWNDKIPWLNFQPLYYVKI